MIVGGNKMLKCKVCGSEFIPRFESHCICRDSDVTGLSTINKKDEVKMYDAFDCPNCGCQVIAQDRKRIVK